MLVKGAKTDKISYRFSQETVDAFNQAIGISADHPQGGKASLTLPIQLMMALETPWKEDIPHPLVHGRQTFSYEAELQADVDYDIQLSLKSVRPMKSDGQDVIMFEQVIEGFLGKDLQFSGTSLLVGYLSKEEA